MIVAEEVVESNDLSEEVLSEFELFCLEFLE
jgi:hypothetical protein